MKRKNLSGDPGSELRDRRRSGRNCKEIPESLVVDYRLGRFHGAIRRHGSFDTRPLESRARINGRRSADRHLSRFINSIIATDTPDDKFSLDYPRLVSPRENLWSTLQRCSSPS